MFLIFNVFTLGYKACANSTMDPESKEMIKEIESKVILHWNYRHLVKFPEMLRTYGGHIQEIYLKWNRLITLPSWITELCNLTNLYVSSNLIRELPGEFGIMTKLTVLDLSDNELEWIPSCIGNLSNLKTLLLNDNFIEKLPLGK
jgi:Leucine-rich repeat (LRR) protein